LETIARIFGKLRDATKVVIRLAQRVVMAVSLFLVYFFAVGLTKALALVFQRHLVRWDPPGQDSYWVTAQGYDPDPERSLHQT
jgi:hypothetical protein